MKRRLMDFLACAMCKSHPLVLHVFEEKGEINHGILICPSEECRMWYPIIDDIPHCLPPNLREEKEDTSFLRKWKNQIPEKILRQGCPFNLSKEIS